MAGIHERPTAESHGTPLGSTTRDTVVVHGRGVHVGRADLEVPTAEARHRFGGVDPVAVLAGALTALGSLALLGALAGLVLRTGFDRAADPAVSVAGLVTALVLLTLSLLLGGYVAGRVARYDGARNGLLAGLLFVLLTAGLSAAAAADDGVRDLGLPAWLDRDTATTAAVVTSLVALALALGAATLGGRLGSRWHRRPDGVLLGTRPGGVAPYPRDNDRMETT